MTREPIASIPAEPYLFADHLALDLLNTQAEVGGQPLDFWRSCDDVLRWLERCGVFRQPPGKELDPPAFLAAAKKLRQTARMLIERRKQGNVGDPTELNGFLEALNSTPWLEWTSSQDIRLIRRFHRDSAWHSLGVVAEAVATLLAEGDFQLVKQCEHDECVMWFYDRTKAHRRRWCSMALCGNRHKASQFRKRASAGIQR